jgi:hypothetical protein
MIKSGDLPDVEIVSHQDERAEADIESRETVAAGFH